MVEGSDFAGSGVVDPGRASIADSDESLAEMAATDREAFIALYHRHVRSIYAYMVVRVGPDQTEDLTADVFVRALEGIHRFDAARSFRPWLFGIARHVVFMFYKKHKIETSIDDRRWPVTASNLGNN